MNKKRKIFFLIHIGIIVIIYIYLLIYNRRKHDEFYPILILYILPSFFLFLFFIIKSFLTMAYEYLFKKRDKILLSRYWLLPHSPLFLLKKNNGILFFTLFFKRRIIPILYYTYVTAFLIILICIILFMAYTMRSTSF